MRSGHGKSVRVAAGVVLALLWAATGTAAEMQLNRYFSDGMVLQRDKVVVIRGTAEPNAGVTVGIAGQEATARADASGQWTAELQPMPADSEAQDLVAAAGDQSVILRDILIGDVFLFARQSSIDVSLGKDEAGRRAAARHGRTPLLRAVRIRTVPAATPQSELAAAATTGWQAVTSESALSLSGAAYHFGRGLAESVDVPIGVVDLDMGPHFPIGWLSRDALDQTEKLYGKSDVPGTVSRMEKLADLHRRGEPMPRKEVVSVDPLEYPLYPAAGYNAVIHPLRGIAFKGLIVQLGGNYPYIYYEKLRGTDRQGDREALNAAYVMSYDIRKTGFRMDAATMPRIPGEWRRMLGDPDLPMALVMAPGSELATFAEHNREMRELQRKMALENPALGLIVPDMQAVPFSAQPRDEALLGRRGRSWALGAVYDRGPGTGPVFDRIETDMNAATVYFQPGTADGLRTEKGGPDHFEVAGVEADFVPAEAVVDGDVVRIESDTVNRIVHVRYNWRQQPEAGLVNAAGLPAVPFSSEDSGYEWFFMHSEDDLPIEYSTPANTWEGGDVTLVNGQLKTHGYPNFTGWLGPVGVRTGPFGPNMGVREIRVGSPADGKLFVGDVIYSANGEMLGDKAWEVMAAAVTESETAAADGKLLLGVRRDGRNQDVEIELEVMGSYSSTAPYDCLKTEKIVARLEEWLAARGGPAGFLGTDALFLLGSGNPEYQGLVRRVIYDKIGRMDPSKPIDPTEGPKAWYPAWDSLLLGEYYSATGDRNVLPYLKYQCDLLAAKQHPAGAWRHNYPGGDNYGLMPALGEAAAIGFHLANAAGLDISQEAYRKVIKYYHDGQAEMGSVIYGIYISRSAPPEFEPEKMNNGLMATHNGALGSAAVLFNLEGDTRTAHLCSEICCHAWNNTYEGHGGNFWNNFWTPLGAKVQGKKSFIAFWKHYRWYREMNRMYDGGLIIDQQGKAGAGTGLALVAPRRRLRILGAPESPFAANAPEILRPALAAYYRKDYAGCEREVEPILESGLLGKSELRRVERLAQAAREMQASIDADLSRMEALIAEGRLHEASLDLTQLRGVVAAGNARLAAVEKALKEGEPRENDAKRYRDSLASVKTGVKKAPDAAKDREWECLVTEVVTGKDKTAGKVPEEVASKWRLKVLEGREQAPEGWMKPRFDDGDWFETTLPISWHLNHTALLRTTFEVDDRDEFDGLRFRAWLFRQQGIEIYLNGKVIGKVNNLKKKTGNVDAVFNDGAVRHVKNGENSLAIVTRNNWRWGMLFMRVYNGGFGFRLDARLAEK